MSTPQDEAREKFELRAKGFPSFFEVSTYRPESNSYDDDNTQFAWLGYRWAIASLTQQIEELKRDLKDCGREMCMGQRIEGCRNWVSQEAYDVLQRQVSELKEALRRVTEDKGDEL